MLNHDEGGEHTIAPAEAEKMNKEMEIRNAGSFIDLLISLKNAGPIKGNQGEYSLNDNLSNLIGIIESNAKNEKLDFTFFTRNMGLRDKVKELAATLKKSDTRELPNADWFIFEVAKDRLPMEDWPMDRKEWMEKVTEAASTKHNSTSYPIEALKARGQKDPKLFYLRRILEEVESEE